MQTWMKSGEFIVSLEPINNYPLAADQEDERADAILVCVSG